MGFFNKAKKEPTTKTIDYEYLIENTNQKLLKKIYETEFSIAEIYLQPYNDNNSIKVLELQHDTPIGDIMPKDVLEVLGYNLKLGKIIVDSQFDNDGHQFFKGTVFFTRTINI